MDQKPVRRRSMQWVRDKDSQQLHGIAGKLLGISWNADLTPGQEKLWAMVISELEYRARTTRPVWARCTCQFCWNPFDAVSGVRPFEGVAVDPTEDSPVGRVVLNYGRLLLGSLREFEATQGDEEGSPGDDE